MIVGKNSHLKPRTHFLEMHVSHACNLTCESCSHFSDQKHKGNIDINEADAWMEAWDDRIDVDIFKLVGGEPTIHPQLSRFPPLVRKHWLKAEIWIITNGFFLHRHPDLPLVLRDTGNCHLYLSIHHEDRSYVEKIKPAIELLQKWNEDYGISVTTWAAHARWSRRYKGLGNDSRPFVDGNPRMSWENCAARDSRQLFNGRIWKCPPITYLQLQNKKYKLTADWSEYLDYEPLDSSCSDQDLDRFLSAKDETICGMCSSNPQMFKLKNPLPSPFE